MNRKHNYVDFLAIYVTGNTIFQYYFVIKICFTINELDNPMYQKKQPRTKIVNYIIYKHLII